MTPKSSISLHEPVFAGNEWKYVKDCLDTGWVSSSGSFVTRFEKDVAARVGVGHAVAVSTGTAALHLAMKLLGVGPGDEVIVPSLTFIATCNAAVYEGAVPRFVDVEEATYGLDPAAVERFLAEKTRRKGGRLIARDTGRRIAACMPMHALGHPARIDALLEVCGRYGLPVVEDAAEALGSFYRGKSLGSFGALAALSFNGNKILTTGGGGMLVTDDKALASRARHLSTQAKKDPAAYWHDAVGFNYRLPNINAALGCAQLEQLDGFLTKKRRIAQWYRESLEGAEGLALVWEPAEARSNFWLNTVRADSPRRAARLLKRLTDEGVGARPLWAPCHLQPMFKKAPRERMTTTERLWRTSFNVPSTATLSRDTVRAVARLLTRS
jgi:perosamine synthetase